MIIALLFSGSLNLALAAATGSTSPPASAGAKTNTVHTSVAGASATKPKSVTDSKAKVTKTVATDPKVVPSQEDDSFSTWPDFEGPRFNLRYIMDKDKGLDGYIIWAKVPINYSLGIMWGQGYSSVGTDVTVFQSSTNSKVIDGKIKEYRSQHKNSYGYEAKKVQNSVKYKEHFKMEVLKDKITYF